MIIKECNFSKNVVVLLRTELEFAEIFINHFNFLKKSNNNNLLEMNYKLKMLLTFIIYF